MTDWINTKDQLPKFNEKVFFFAIQDGKIKNQYMGHLTEDGWSIYLPYTSFKLDMQYFEVTRWRPLFDEPVIDLSEFKLKLSEKAHKLKDIAKNMGLLGVDIRDCSICGTMFGYKFLEDHKNNDLHVFFDGNCSCLSYCSPLQPRTWKDVAIECERNPTLLTAFCPKEFFPND